MNLTITPVPKTTIGYTSKVSNQQMPCQSPKQVFFGKFSKPKQAITILGKLQETHNKNNKYILMGEERAFETIRGNITAQTAPFIKRLVTKIVSVRLNIEEAAVISNHYKANPKSRHLMKEFLDDPQSDLIKLGDKGVFGNAYKGTESQNAIIEYMSSVKDRKFSGRDYYSLEESVTPENLEFAKQLLVQKAHQNKVVTANPQKIAQLISEETYPNIFTQRKNIEALSLETPKAEYLIRDINYIGFPLAKYKTEMQPLMEKLLPEIENIDQLNTFMGSYTPKLEGFCQKGLKQLKQGSLTIQEFIDALAYKAN